MLQNKINLNLTLKVETDEIIIGFIFNRFVTKVYSLFAKVFVNNIQYTLENNQVRIPLNSITEIHNLIQVSLFGKLFDLNVDKMSNYLEHAVCIERQIVNDKIYVIRSTENNQKVMLTIINNYEGSELNLDLQLQNYLNRNVVEPKYITFFEKKSLSIGESAFIIFSKYAKSNSNFRFVLSPTNPSFKQLKVQYGDQLVAKGTKEYIEVIIQSKLLVSSELPNHLLSDRVVDYQFINYIYKIPYIFLQHGIMLGKPIKNPMARGFWKKNIKYNLIKTVVSSELEKEEFYKVGYTDNDLIKTGLATFDMIVPCEKKFIVYMPTYRAWDEYDFYNGRAETTSYVQDIIEVSNSVRQAGYKLTVIPHPKFAEYLQNYDQFDVIESLTNIRDEIKVFITDFSSAIFEAQHRGAYAIYLWNRRTEFEAKFKSKAPINISNTNGVVCETTLELIEALIYAESVDYTMDSYYMRNFNAACEMRDGRSCERIYDAIIEVADQAYELDMRFEGV